MLNILHIFWINLHFKRFRNLLFAGIEQKHGDAGEIARSRENASPVRYLPKSAPKGNTVIRRYLCPCAPSLPDAVRGRFCSRNVGIFCVDGAMYCKQYYVDSHKNLVLVSANPDMKSSNIHISKDGGRSVRLCGKVLLGQRIGLPEYLRDGEE